jgi:hypothetical protein
MKYSLELFCLQILNQDFLLGLKLQELEQKAHELSRLVVAIYAADG